MQDYFHSLADFAVSLARGAEVVLLNFSAERSDFVRFNRSLVRQPMSVQQGFLTVTLIEGARRDMTRLTLALDRNQDDAAVRAAIDAMRRDAASLPADPYLLYATDATHSEVRRSGTLAAPRDAVDDVLAAAGSADLVGILASGPVYRGFANSLGARHWHQVDSFLFDWSLVAAGDKAVKCTWAGSAWDRAELQRRMDAARGQLPLLARAPRAVPPGEYRALFSPAAVEDLLSMLSWGGVSAKSQRTRQSAIQQLVQGDVALAPQIDLRENIADGLAPAFDGFGFARPPSVDLVRGGHHAGSLVSPRTAREYDLAHNGANDEEMMESLDLGAGLLAADRALAALHTGILVSNVWYLNWSDQPSCRITGMTRFATFWVERGEIVAPLAVMRFDDSLYRLFGTRLEALGHEREWIVSRSTYRERSVETSRVPAALVSGLALTL
jgi:predicted Zn-dependent protease